MYGRCNSTVLAASLPLISKQPPLNVEQLTRFVHNPAQAFFRQRLGVYFEGDDGVVEDDEIFQLGGLQAYGVVQELQQQFAADWEYCSNVQGDGVLPWWSAARMM